MEKNTIKLPEEIFSLENGTYEGENYQLTINGETGYFWIKLPPIPVNRDMEMNFYVPGILPVACCAAKWTSETFL